MSLPSALIPSKSEDPQEIRIKLPWGHIAGKWWGPKHVRPILCLHGWQDNAGTFDRLIPLLPKHVGYLAIDLPGHGLSSRLPDGLLYINFESVPLLKHIKKIYKWDKMSILAHSMGSVFTYNYAGFYPDDIDMIIGIDSLAVLVRDIVGHIESMPEYLNSFFVSDQRNRSNIEPPSYTYDGCIKKVVEASVNSIDHVSAPYLLNRNIAKSAIHPDRYYFTRDNRLKAMIYLLTTQEMNLEIAKRIKCPHLHIRAKDGLLMSKREHHIELVEQLRKSNPRFEYQLVDGTHHVHLTRPERVKGIISDFINKYRPPSSPSSKL